MIVKIKDITTSNGNLKDFIPNIKVVVLFLYFNRRTLNSLSNT